MKNNTFNNNVNVIGINLKKYRQQQKMSQEKLCDKLALLGITYFI